MDTSYCLFIYYILIIISATTTTSTSTSTPTTSTTPTISTTLTIPTTPTTSTTGKTSLLILVISWWVRILFSKNWDVLVYFQFLANCICKDLLTNKGSGNCLKESQYLNNKVFCYVNQPTSCKDALDSSELPGEKYQAQACPTRKFALHPIKNNSTTT